jgi:hypothetical protein
VHPGRLSQRQPQPGTATARSGHFGGILIVGHTLRAGMAADPGCITVLVDW